MKSRSISYPILTAVAVLTLAVVHFTMTRGATSALNLTGAIFTTDSNCNGVDLNIYSKKDDVYLNGGPQGNSGSGLPDGSYCVKVTDPSGATILGQSAPGAVTVVGGKFVQCYQLSTILTKTSDNSAGYDDTPNNGGEYKVWVSPDCSFIPNNTKTDNFKVFDPIGDCETTTLIGTKFYDLDADGQRGSGEVGIPGFKIQVKVNAVLFGETTTDASGAWKIDVPQGVDFEVCEVSTGTNVDGSYWLQTAPDLNSLDERCYLGKATGCEITGLDFGNICVHPPSGGYTLGFWSNRNGQATIKGDDLCLLNACNLKNADGSDFDLTLTCPNPTDPQIANAKTTLKSWLLAGTAVNMANMLSVQLAATKLDTLHTLNASMWVLLTPDLASCYGSNTVQIATVMAKADASLAAHPNTTAPNVFRGEQECLKNILDAINNNQLPFVSPAPCDVTYPTN
jgi:hypothetical protein